MELAGWAIQLANNQILGSAVVAGAAAGAVVGAVLTPCPWCESNDFIELKALVSKNGIDGPASVCRAMRFSSSHRK